MVTWPPPLEGCRVCIYSCPLLCRNGSWHASAREKAQEDGECLPACQDILTKAARFRKINENNNNVPHSQPREQRICSNPQSVKEWEVFLFKYCPVGLEGMTGLPLFHTRCRVLFFLSLSLFPSLVPLPLPTQKKKNLRYSKAGFIIWEH